MDDLGATDCRATTPQASWLRVSRGETVNNALVLCLATPPCFLESLETLLLKRLRQTGVAGYSRTSTWTDRVENRRFVP